MGDKTAIPWADATWSPITGCTPASAGCTNCYASRQISSGRTPAVHHTTDFGRIMFHPERLDIPLRWKKPRRIFVCSMGDFWHPDVTPMARMLVFRTIEKCPQHTFILLTKRAKEMHEDLTNNTMMLDFPRLPNVIGMVTAENQAAADERILWLLKVPFMRRGVSVEPMLGPVVLKDYWFPCPECRGRGWYLERFSDNHGTPCRRCIEKAESYGMRVAPGNIVKAKGWLDWVIVGGESGPGARPMHPDWPRSLRDQCQEAGVPFFFKQWGEWGPGGGGQLYHRSFKVHQWPPPSGAVSIRIGKKAAGCLLDGREWKQFPEVNG
ncbi:MAG: phage Gp37/Gp68 family protein [Deltaproteobacteria bacterium]|nr:phage Gp37/Gp68 family protein [Deltaproteobacteria bacterium]